MTKCGGLDGILEGAIQPPRCLRVLAGMLAASHPERARKLALTLASEAYV